MNNASIECVRRGAYPGADKYVDVLYHAHGYLSTKDSKYLFSEL